MYRWTAFRVHKKEKARDGSKGFGPGNHTVSGVTEVGKIAGGRKNQELSFECVKLRCLLDIQVEM